MANGNPTLSSLQAEIDKQAILLEQYQAGQQLGLELLKVKHDLEQKWNYVRIGGFIVSVAITIMGGIGIRSFADASNKIHEEIDADVEVQRAFYRDLMAGTSLTIQKNYIAAIPKLKKCFDKNHIYDKSVLIPLLEAINLTDDWVDAKQILGQLRSNSQQFDEINDATVYRVIASIEIQSGLSLRSQGGLAEGTLRMDQGFALLKEALAITQPNDYDTRVHILNNFWIYHISNGQINEAHEDVQAIANLPEEAQVYGWSNIQSWRCMKDFAAAKDSKSVAYLQIAEQQWKALKKRYRQ